MSPTAIFPGDPVAADLFGRVGTVFQVRSEVELDAISAATATIATHLAFSEAIVSWLARQGIPEAQGREYFARLLYGTTSETIEGEENFGSLAAQHATAGGLNEQFLKLMIDDGFLKRVSEGLNAVSQRIARDRADQNRRGDPAQGR